MIMFFSIPQPSKRRPLRWCPLWKELLWRLISFLLGYKIFTSLLSGVWHSCLSAVRGEVIIIISLQLQKTVNSELMETFWEPHTPLTIAVESSWEIELRRPGTKTLHISGFSPFKEMSICLKSEGQFVSSSLRYHRLPKHVSFTCPLYSNMSC